MKALLQAHHEFEKNIEGDFSQPCTRCNMRFRPADQRPDGAEVTRCADPGCGKRFAHDDKGRCWDVE